MNKMIDILIIGSGPAGLTAAIYAQRAGKHAVVYEANSYGGKIINASEIANYPGIKKISGFDFATNLYEQAIELGAEIRIAKVYGIEDKGETKLVKTTDGDVEARSVIIATGASSKALGLTNESEYLGKGISYCATCDGAFFANMDVAVVGGGDTALEDALYLSNTCHKVYLIHRRDEFKGNQVWVEDLKKKENVEFILNSNVTKLIGDSVLKEIEVTNNVGEVRNIEVACLFVAVGQTPGNGAFENIIKLDEKGYVEAGEDCLTNVKGIFVAGDTRSKVVRQLTTACADGAVAALAAVNYIR